MNVIWETKKTCTDEPEVKKHLCQRTQPLSCARIAEAASIREATLGAPCTITRNVSECELLRSKVKEYKLQAKYAIIGI